MSNLSDTTLSKGKKKWTEIGLGSTLSEHTIQSRNSEPPDVYWFGAWCVHSSLPERCLEFLSVHDPAHLLILKNDFTCLWSHLFCTGFLVKRSDITFLPISVGLFRSLPSLGWSGFNIFTSADSGRHSPASWLQSLPFSPTQRRPAERSCVRLTFQGNLDFSLTYKQK